ncbi:MAG: ATP-binding protein [Actinomycetota bacterium]|nr:ATP-binding protein [Actinomycetota bacterium]
MGADKQGKILDKEIEIEKLKDVYQRLLEAAPDAMIIVDIRGKILLANVQTEKLFGYSRAELVGKDLHMLIPERVRKEHRGNIKFFFSNPQTRPMGTGLKLFAVKKDGSEFRADISLAPLQIDSDIIVTAAIRDITSRMQAEEQIKLDYEIQRVTSAILKIALEPASLDEQLGHILDLILSIPEPSAQTKGLVYIADEASGKLVLRSYRGFPQAEAAKEDQSITQGIPLSPDVSCDVTRTGSPDAPYEIMCKRISGNHFIHYCIPICEDNKTLGMISIFSRKWPMPEPYEELFFRAVAHTLAIVVKHVRMEAERQSLLEQLSKSERLAELGRISASVAHEIRNPLTVVGGFARLLQKRTADHSEREYANFIVSEVGRLEIILKDILSFSRTITLRLTDRKIHEELDDIIKIYADRLQQPPVSIDRKYDYTDDVSIDVGRMREVVMNVISNALDSMPGGGTLTIATGLENLKGDSYATVRISDTGEGIPADKLDKVFEPFYTTKIAKKGIGLGLSISKKIMEDHGGFITVKSAPQKGSTFTLYFPKKQKTAENK